MVKRRGEKEGRSAKFEGKEVNPWSDLCSRTSRTHTSLSHQRQGVRLSHFERDTMCGGGVQKSAARHSRAVDAPPNDRETR